MENQDRIIGKRVYLRPVTVEDTADIIRWRNSEDVRRYFIYQKPFTAEGHKMWLEKEIFAGKGFQFIVCKTKDDKPIGCAYLRNYDSHSRKAEYGFFLGEVEERGKGIGKEMLNLTMKFAFEELGLHKLYARAFANNMPSVKSFLSCGFEQEAYFRDEEYINARRPRLFRQRGRLGTHYALSRRRCLQRLPFRCRWKQLRF